MSKYDELELTAEEETLLNVERRSAGAPNSSFGSFGSYSDISPPPSPPLLTKEEALVLSLSSSDADDGELSSGSDRPEYADGLSSSDAPPSVRLGDSMVANASAAGPLDTSEDAARRAAVRERRERVGELRAAAEAGVWREALEERDRALRQRDLALQELCAELDELTVEREGLEETLALWKRAVQEKDSALATRDLALAQFLEDVDSADAKENLLRNEISRLEAVVATVSAQRDALVEEIAELEKEIEELIDLQDIQAERMAAAKIQHARKVDDVEASFQARLDAAIAAHAKDSSEMARLQRDVQLLKQERDAEVARAGGAEGDLARAEQEISRLRELNRKVEAQAQARVAEVEGEVERLRDLEREERVRAQAAQAEVERLQGVAEDEVRNVGEAQEAYEIRLRDLEREVEEERVRAQAAQAEVERLQEVAEDEVRNVGEAQEAYEIRLRDLEREVEEERVRAQAADERAERVKAESEIEIRNVGEAQKAYEVRLRDLSTSLAETTNTCTAATEENKALRKQNQELMDDLAIARARIQDLARQGEGERSKVGEAQAAYEARLGDLRTRMATVEEKYASAQQEIQTLQSERQVQEKNVEDAQAAYESRLEDLKRQLQESQEGATQDISALQGQLDAANLQRDALETAVDAAETELARLAAEREELAHTLMNRSSSLESDNASLLSELEAATARNEALQEEMSRNAAAIQDKIDSLQKERATSLEAQDVLKRALSSAKSEVRAAQMASPPPAQGLHDALIDAERQIATLKLQLQDQDRVNRDRIAASVEETSQLYEKVGAMEALVHKQGQELGAQAGKAASLQSELVLTKSKLAVAQRALLQPASVVSTDASTEASIQVVDVPVQTEPQPQPEPQPEPEPELEPSPDHHHETSPGNASLRVGQLEEALRGSEARNAALQDMVDDMLARRAQWMEDRARVHPSFTTSTPDGATPADMPVVVDEDGAVAADARREAAATKESARAAVEEADEVLRLARLEREQLAIQRRFLTRQNAELQAKVEMLQADLANASGLPSSLRQQSKAASRPRRPKLGLVARKSKSGPGLLVSAVSPHSISASAGIVPDDVLLSFNGMFLSTRDDLASVLSLLPSSLSSIPVIVFRSGQCVDLQLQLE